MSDADGVAMVWGRDDCGLFFANAVRDALGFDPAEHWRGRYETREGALSALGPGGLGCAFRFLARKHHWKRIDPMEALSGDPGLQVIGGNVTTFVCRAMGWFVARNETGYSGLRSEHIRLAWTLG